MKKQSLVALMLLMVLSMQTVLVHADDATMSSSSNTGTSVTTPLPGQDTSNPDRNRDGKVDAFEQCAFVDKKGESECKSLMPVQPNTGGQKDMQGGNATQPKMIDTAILEQAKKIAEECLKTEGATQEQCIQKVQDFVKSSLPQPSSTGDSTGLQKPFMPEMNGEKNGMPFTDGKNNLNRGNAGEAMMKNEAKMPTMSAENFNSDLNNDGTTDDFEQKVADCLKENNYNMPLCQMKVKMALKQEFSQMNAEDLGKKLQDNSFLKSFDPSLIQNNQAFNPDILNTLSQNAPEKFRKLDPKLITNMGESELKQLDPSMFANMKQFGQYIDPSVFGKMNDTAFFENLDPNFLNSVKANKIPDSVLKNIDPSKFTEISPDLLKALEKKAPEVYAKIPEEVKKSAEIEGGEVSDATLKEYGFDSAEAEKVKKLLKALENKRREKVLPVLEKLPEQTQKNIFDMQSGKFGSQMTNFMEYLPQVPPEKQQSFADDKKKILDAVQKLSDALAAKTDISTAAQTQITAFIKDVSTYNFAGESVQEVITLTDSVVSALGTSDIDTLASTLSAKLAELKAKSNKAKFADNIIPFKDTDDSEWFTYFVNSAVQNGVIGGYKDAQGKSLGEFRPANKVTVAESIKMILGNAGVKEEEGTPSNTTAQNHWATKWIKAAENLALTLNATDDINAQATRGNVIKWVIQSYGITPPTATSSSFSDVALTDPNVNYIEYAKTMGIISGDGSTGTFRPNDTIIRAEVAKILEKAKEVLAK